MEVQSPPLVTPDPVTVVNVKVKKPLRNKIIAGVAALLTGLAALGSQLAAFNFQSLGLTPQEAAWIGFGFFVLQWFVLTYLTPLKVDIEARPGRDE